MGASNAIAAYQRYAGKIPNLSLVVLVRMALVSKDKDAWPWYGEGQAALAEHALGRPNPTPVDLRAVQRAMGPLIDVEAVTVDRAGAARTDGNTTARYRLNLHSDADEARREWLKTPDGKRRVSNPHKSPRDPTVSGKKTRRKVTRDPTVSDERPVENRRTKETGGDRRSEKTEEEDLGVRTALTLARVPSAEREPPKPAAPVVEIFPGASAHPPYVAPAPKLSFAQRNLAEAAARRARAVAEHQASKEAT